MNSNGFISGIFAPPTPVTLARSCEPSGANNFEARIFLPPGGSDGGRLFTKEELKQHDGDARSDIYLAVAGKVYDVTKGARFYAKGKHYGGFSGKFDQISSHIRRGN